VEQVAREVGYVPNFASQSLALGSPQTVGVYITPMPCASVGAEYESAILRGVERACHAAGYDMLILNISGSQGAEHCLRKIATGRVDGVVVVRAWLDRPGLVRLPGACDNVVAVDYNDPEPRALPAAGFDNAQAMNLAVDHLVGLGHRRIGYVGSNVAAPPPDDLSRRAAFAARMSHHGLSADPSHLYFDAPLEPLPPVRNAAQHWGWAVADRVIEQGAAGPTALVVWSDSVAVTLLQRLAERGVRVPDEVSLVGVDNSPVCSVVHPRLTSVARPLPEIGERATQMLIEKSLAKRDARGGPTPMTGPTRRVVFAPELVVGGTTGRCRAGAEV
jgi:DNA-binding LacI/PurR family transcriptional regulator